MILPTCVERRVPRHLRVAGLLLLVLVLGGCATPQLSRLEASVPAGLQRPVELASVPFHPQEDYQCGPAALAMVLEFGGASLAPETLAPQVFLPQNKGSLQPEMLAAARRQGFVALPIAPKLDDLLREVSAGHPVIVLQNLGLDWIPVWHYAVVIGYDLARRTLVLRSGRERRLELPLTTFERTWARGGHWGMLALRPPELPATIGADDYVRGASILEALDKPTAQRAYEAALARWPDHPVALMGLGNMSYASGNLVLAEQSLRRAATVRPDSAAIFNNWAQVLFELGRHDEAIAAALQSVRLGGPQYAVAQRTLEEIRRGGTNAVVSPSTR